MSPNLSQVDELAAKVRADPFDPAPRRALVAALIEAGDLVSAEHHFDVLSSVAREEPWIFELEEVLATSVGDTLRAARARRRSKEFAASRDNDETSHSDDDQPTNSHPSDAVPKLRLLSGGASVDAIRFSTNTLDDVAGLTTVKALLRQIVDEVNETLDNTEGPWVGGALLYGPPGCGKKFCASVVAGELNAEFVVVDLAESWSHDSLQGMLTTLIEANNGRRTVLFFDNLDERFGPDHATAVEPLLKLLDSARTKAKLVIVGSAITPWQVSAKIAAAGRLRRVILVLPPDAPARYLFTSRYAQQNDVMIDEPDMQWLAHQTDGHSFADLKRLLDMAIEQGESALSHTTLRKALQQVPQSSADWLTHAGHHALMNEAGGMYDDLLAYFRNRTR